MGFQRNLEGYTPPARYPPDDGGVYDRARIEENTAPVDAGATVIEPVFTLSPAYLDPADPRTYDLTTTGALLPEGWYRIVWLATDGVEQATEWQQLRNLSPYAPSVGDVGSILRARLVELGGNRVDAFTDHTEPSAQAIAHAIQLHSPLVLMTLGDLGTLGCSNAEDLRAAARSLAAQRVAIEVELSFRPEEVGESAAAATAERRLMLDADLTRLATAVAACREIGGGTDPGGGDPGSTGRSDPAWSFPRPVWMNW